MNPPVSICIVTRNRKDDLLVALRSCLAQTYKPLEILVYDAASTDGTGEAVRSLSASVVYRREETDRGLPALRNRSYREAAGEIVVTLDDDAYYTDATTIEQVVAEFQRQPGIAAIAMPFISPRHGAAARPESTPAQRLRSFTGCSHAMRRDIALRMGPYREISGYYREDRDLGIRLLGAGQVIVKGALPPVVHMHSPSRDWQWRYGLDTVSTILFDFLNIPLLNLIPRMGMDIAQLLVYRFSFSQLLPRLGHVARGLQACVRNRGARAPVSREAYSLYRCLPSHGQEPWEDAVPVPIGARGKTA